MKLKEIFDPKQELLLPKYQDIDRETKGIKYGGSCDSGFYELCPLCGNEITYLEGTSFPKKAAVPKDERDDLRQVADVRIHFLGDCGHKWIREWHTYKGTTFVRVFVPKEEQIF